MARHLRILMVDDNPELLRVLQEGLARYDVEVVTALDASQAIDILIHDQGFDVLVSDVLMPRGLSGVQLVEMISREHPQIAVVLTSGYAQSQLPPLPRGVRFLPKPYQFGGLMSALTEEARLP
ncbi:response regulator [Pseudoxanthomonas sp.]|uniref:response regulator n=1 Tax=Pseudoxanthomonas sp. TaxID=1871049 RepID=UPI00262F8D95|nr:response regulator [Pseudoxanthomonas sp.]WDS37316.1 MAG: response regulator [Pseudoxanthomonas sp.]